MKVVVIGGGVSGFSAAMVAKKTGAEVTLIERTDALGGLGLVAGIGMLGEATPIYAEEKALGGGDLIDIFYSIATHKGIKVPGVGNDVLLYNVTRLDASMQKALNKAGVEFMLQKTVVDAEISGNKVKAVKLQDYNSISGDAFVDATGATNGPTDCDEFGRGCVECIYRCPKFGPPGGIVEKKMGTVARVTAYGKPGVIGTSVLVPIVSLSTEIQQELAENGHVSIPVPPDAVLDEDRMKRAGAPLMFRENIHTKNVILLDIGGFIKVTALGSPMWAGSLRSFPGLEDSFIMQPTAGALGHLVSWTTMALRDNSLKADGFDNLFCSGHKAGPHITLMDAIVTGDLAGYNAARYGAGQNCLELPKNLIVGAFIDHIGKIMRTKEGLTRGWGILELEILKNLKVYKEDKDQAIKDVEKAGLKGIYQTKVC